MNYDRAYPYLESSDSIGADIPPWSRELADLLAVPDPLDGGFGTIALNAGVGTYTLVPGLVSPTLTLDEPTWCLARISTYVTGTVDAYHYLRLRVTGSDGVVWSSGANHELGLWRQTSWQQLIVWKVLRLGAGATGAAVRAEYRTPGGTSASLVYPRTDLVPLRAAV